MEQNQHEQRRVADQEFQKSLEQLQHILQDDSIETEQTPESHSDHQSDAPLEQLCDRQITETSSIIDLDLWEDAVADIEQYFQQKGKS
ncbi:MAG: hypothetical protein KME28_12770 [Pelatocladus maniniholoensis HA4357-MV3]|jgi:hypothetical protein|uniref:Uncharacterized protein n=1 Tax=Pelatocladus maniniholoensis HA4357-MV3 TaxID=1117104 RepID=A0A9E3LU28_9NOST|nr:hypothetical protein [Pelatocladus maniniholoensis HA4357-MV3]BAZ70479.1 hypothetical protein NIES4106_52740 [Fischerella sp. NIES-4106]